jgi:hypothetical protein
MEATGKPPQSSISHAGPSPTSWSSTPLSVLQEGTTSLKSDVHRTFVNTLTIYIFVVHFVGRGSPSQRRSSSLTGGPDGANWSRVHLGNRRPPEITGHQRFPRMKPLDSGHMSAYDWQGTKIFVNTERP